MNLFIYKKGQNYANYKINNNIYYNFFIFYGL